MTLSALQLGNALAERFRRECRIPQTEAELWTAVAQAALDQIAIEHNWRPWTEAHEYIVASCPKPPQVGQHRVRVTSLEERHRLLLVDFDNDGKPEAFMVITR